MSEWIVSSIRIYCSIVISIGEHVLMRACFKARQGIRKTGIILNHNIGFIVRVKWKDNIATIMVVTEWHSIG